MPDFAYRAATPAGRTVRGVEESTSALRLEDALRARGLFPLEVSPTAWVRPERQGFRSRRADVTRAIRYLSTLTEAGFTLDRALGTAARIAARRDVGETLVNVREQVRGGTPLADAFAEHPRLFPQLAVGMARAGERGGHLAAALGRLADHLERENRLRSQVVSAMIYPLLIAAVGGTAVVVLVLYVLPRFLSVIDTTEATLPLSTRILMGVTGVIGDGWHLLLGGLVAAVLAVSAFRRTETGREAIDGLLNRVPLIGPLRRRLAAARFGRSLSTLLANGLPILPALEIAAGSLGDAVASREVARARDEVKAGVRLAVALRRGGVFPFVFLQMLELGEESGKLPEMLDRAAQSAEEELERHLERLVRLMEPAMIVIFGALAGFIALSLLQAIYGIRLEGL